MKGQVQGVDQRVQSHTKAALREQSDYGQDRLVVSAGNAFGFRFYCISIPLPRGTWCVQISLAKWLLMREVWSIMDVPAIS